MDRIEYGTFKDKKVMKIITGDGASTAFNTFTFGLGKAQKMVENIEAIKAWVRANPYVPKAKKLTNAELLAQNAELLAQINAKTPVVSPAKK